MCQQFLSIERKSKGFKSFMLQKGQKGCEKVIHTQLESSEEQNLSGYSFSSQIIDQLDR